MRKILALVLVVTAALFGAQTARAADMPQYPDIQVPEVDYGLQGAFYLRASVGANLLWTREHIDICGCSVPPTGAGYGYSLGAGFGYETGDGLRADVTLDYLSNDGLTDSINHLHLRSTIALANVYYDFPIGGSMGGSAEGGFGAYVGAGLGGAYYTTVVHDNATDSAVAGVPDGSGWTPAAAAMAGVTYDAGTWVADLGYRMIYMPQISNNAVGPDVSWYINDNTVHEIRASMRYRLN